MSRRTAIHQLLAAQLRNPDAGFSIGAFGAVAEFTRDPDEPLVEDRADSLRTVTARGGLAVRLTDRVVPIAYEILSARTDRWLHGIEFCLPLECAHARRRTVLTELGADRDALRPEDQTGTLFDMGLGARNVDFCVRTNDPALLARLRAGTGRSVLQPDSRVMDAIVEASPTRIAISAIGRLEVYQSIGRHRTPRGPHTHVLPKLLQSGRTHSANIPVPSDLMPVLSAYPPSPIYDAEANPIRFDRNRHRAFQELLAVWGLPEFCAEKARAAAAVDSDQDPDRYRPGDSRLARTGLRVALRQMAYLADKTDNIDLWRARFDSVSKSAHAA